MFRLPPALPQRLPRNNLLLAAFALFCAVAGDPALAQRTAATRATAALNISIVIPHYVSLRVIPVLASSAEARTFATRAGNAGPMWKDALSDAGDLRLTSVAVTANKGQVVVTQSLREDEASSASRATDILRVGVFNTGGGQWLAPPASSGSGDFTAMPASTRAGVTRHKALWVQLYERGPQYLPAGGIERQAEPLNARTTYVAAIF